MARARSGGGGLGVALVVFIIAFVFALIAAIIFASQKSSAIAERDEAEDRLRQVANANELASVQKPAEVTGTLVGYLANENQELKRLISSQPEVPAESLQAQAQELGVQQALFDEVQRLNNELAAANSRADQAEQAARAAAERVAAAEESKNQIATQYTEATNELKGQIDALTADVAAYRQGIEGSDTALAQQMAQTRREKDQQIAELEQQLRQSEAEIVRLRNEIQDLTVADATTGENIVPADGQVTGVAEGGNLVYLNIGAREHVLLGTTFEVFNETDLVKTDEYNQVRGKATVEVVSVGQDGSQARIVRRSHRAILGAGDKIINLVFDPNKTYRFHIFGDFDVNQDGQATEAELELVESLVRSWGGVVTGELSHEVDYLVLGNEPPLPDPLPQDIIDPVLIQRNVEQQRVYEQYQALRAEADRMRIPVLNQNRFLSLVGYYER